MNKAILTGRRFAVFSLVAAILFLTQTAKTCGQQQVQPVKLEMVLQLGHSGKINDIVFSRDSQMVLTASDDRTAIVWDVQTGQIKARLEGHPGAVSNLYLSRDGKVLAATSSQGVSCGTGDGYIEVIKFWDTQTWQIKGRIIQGQAPGVSSILTFSPDMQRALIHNEYDTALWDMESGKQRNLGKITPAAAEFLKNGEVICIAFSKPGSAVMQWLDDKTWNLKRTQNLEGFFEPVEAITFSPNGKTLAVTLSRNLSIQLWDTQTGQYKRTLTDSENAYHLEFLNDGKIIKAFSQNGQLKLWDVETGKLIRSSSVSREKINALSPDFKISADVESGTTIALREVVSGKLIRKLTGQGLPAKISSEGRKSLLDVWNDAPSKDVIINSVRFSPDGKLFAQGSSNTVRLWNIEALNLVGSLNGHTDEVTALDFAPDGKTIASSSQDGSVKFWDVETHKLKRTLTDVKNSERLIAFDANGTFVSKGIEDEQIFAISSDRKLVFGAANADSLHMRDRSSGKILKTLTPTQDGFSPGPFPDWASAGAFSADGNRLAVGDGCGSLFLFSVTTGKVIHDFSPQTESTETDSQVGAVETINAIAFAPDGKTIAVGSDSGAIQLLDANTRKLKFKLPRHANQVASLAFSPDGRILLSGGYDRTVKLWDADSGRLLVTLMILPAEKAGQTNNWIAFTPEAYYSGSPGVEMFIRWREGEKLFSAERFARTFNRPDLVAKALQAR